METVTEYEEIKPPYFIGVVYNEKREPVNLVSDIIRRHPGVRNGKTEIVFDWEHGLYDIQKCASTDDLLTIDTDSNSTAESWETVYTRVYYTKRKDRMDSVITKFRGLPSGWTIQKHIVNTTIRDTVRSILASALYEI